MKKQSSKKKAAIWRQPANVERSRLVSSPFPLKAVQREGMVSRSGGDADPRAVRVRRVVVPGVGRVELQDVVLGIAVGSATDV